MYVCLLIDQINVSSKRYEGHSLSPETSIPDVICELLKCIYVYIFVKYHPSHRRTLSQI